MKYITKLNTLVSFVVIAGLFLFSFFYRKPLCLTASHQHSCNELFNQFTFIALLVFALLVPVIFTIPFNQTVFKSWKKFAVVVIPVFFLITLLLFYNIN